ncbi:phosphoribosyl-ATP pyrophosphohydrolase [Salicibibacter halophilus]|uniref:Phosphoribosyl-ATP pyrophosphohydrolase n=1 Tax=Salicibibacter halophilus TaxID=2502791 RepID=A0A514LJQ6_9BACI|nr:nucleoside triphosphate pyrophosphohydrolase [Salicibibacter halophilus]QDI92088.1 phosphoribosyl-ATP pyrophosphohydrolase [Salicibibacter halophilus]
MPKYHKLVRDKIPEIIENQGKKVKIRTLDKKAYHQELRTKLQEEIKEYLNADSSSQSMEELADVLEVIHHLAESHDASFEDVEKVRKEKAEERGGFKERIWLEEVHDD